VVPACVDVFEVGGHGGIICAKFVEMSK
jgi:hypothetical protein